MIKNWPAKRGDIRDVGLIPGSGRSPGGGNGDPLQYSCQVNPMDLSVHGIDKISLLGYDPWGSQRVGH